MGESETDGANGCGGRGNQTHWSALVEVGPLGSLWFGGLPQTPNQTRFLRFMVTPTTIWIVVGVYLGKDPSSYILVHCSELLLRVC